MGSALRNPAARQQLFAEVLPQQPAGFNSDEFDVPPQSMVLPPVHQGNVTSAELPIYYRVKVFPPQHNTECILAVTLNRQCHGRGGDGISVTLFTAYASVDRHDLTFRTSVFNDLLQVVEHSQGTSRLLRANEWNEMGMAISERQATYWINGSRIATAYFSERALLQHGALYDRQTYLGVFSRNTTYKVRGFTMSRDPGDLKFVCNEAAPLIAKALTNYAARSFSSESERSDSSVPEIDMLAIKCMSFAGEEVAEFDDLDPVKNVSHLRSMLEERLGLNEFQSAAIVLR